MPPAPPTPTPGTSPCCWAPELQTIPYISNKLGGNQAVLKVKKLMLGTGISTVLPLFSIFFLLPFRENLEAIMKKQLLAVDRLVLAVDHVKENAYDPERSRMMYTELHQKAFGAEFSDQQRRIHHECTVTSYKRHR